MKKKILISALLVASVTAVAFASMNGRGKKEKCTQKKECNTGEKKQCKWKCVSTEI